MISNRAHLGKACPVCAGKIIIVGLNDLRTTNPELCKEWSSKNGDVKPEQFTHGSQTRIWWQCKNGHEWKSTIGNRVRGNGCPFCAKEPVIKGVNDLKTTHPELLKYWSEKNEIDPSDIRASYRKQVCWNCGQCGNEYLAQPHSVISRKGIGCKRCQSTVGKGWKSLIHMTLKGHLVRSKSEVIIANMLYSAGIDYEYEKQLTWDNGDKLLPDFTIEDIEHDVCIYWEHCGMLGDYSYRQRWEEKKKIYALHGIKEGDNLLVSKDSLNGAINSADLQQIIDVLKDVLGISDEGNGNDNAYDNISTNENLEEKDNQPIDYESLNGSYALNEDLIPAALRDNAIDLPVTGDLDGWYYLVQFDGRLDNYTHKNTEEMRILVLINGSERSIKVNVMREDHIIYISQTMFSLFEAELSDPDGIKIFF